MTTLPHSGVTGRRFVKTTLPVIAVGAVCTLTLSGCFSNSDNSSDGSNEKATIDLAFAPKSSLSPYSEDAYLDTRMGVAETLVNLDKSGAIKEGLATKWENTDSKTVTFTLRDGVKFQDGSDLNAKAVVNSLQHAWDASSRPKGLGKTELTFSAEGDDKVKVSLKEDDPILTMRFTDPGTVILAESAFSGDNVDLVGKATGPFVLKDQASSTRASLEANNDYWGGKPKLSEISVNFVGEGATRATDVRTGNANLATAIPINQMGQLGDAKVASIPTQRAAYLQLNTSKGMFVDPNLRATVAKTIDTKAITDSVFEGKAEAGSGALFNPTADWASSTKSATLSTDGADNNLAKGKTIKLATWTDRSELPETASVVADQLRKVGFNVDITTADYASLEQRILDGEFDIVLSSRNAVLGAGDPVSFLQSDYTCDGSYNLSKLCQADLDKEIKDAAEITDESQRYRKAAEIGTHVTKTNAVIPIAYQNAYIASNGLKNFAEDPFEHQIITQDTERS